MTYTFLIILGVKDVDSIRFSLPAKRGGKVLDFSWTVVALNICCTNKDKDDIPPADCGRQIFNKTEVCLQALPHGGQT